jgi:hypothetical protein
MEPELANGVRSSGVRPVGQWSQNRLQARAQFQRQVHSKVCIQTIKAGAL